MRRIAALAFSVALFALAQDSQPPAPTPPKAAQNDKGKPAREQGETPNYQSAANSISAAINKPASEVAAWKQQESGKQNEGKASNDWWAIGSAFVSALATIAIAVLAFFQWRTMDRQRCAMDAQAIYMRDGLVETKKAADAATAGVEVARSSMQMAQRAYVGVTSVVLKHQHPKFASMGNILTDAAIEVRCKNSGNTRAADFFVRLVISVDGFMHLVFKPTRWETEPTSLSPGKKHSVVSKTIGELYPTATDQMLSSIVNERLLRVEGEIHYRDVFGFGFTVHCVAVLGAKGNDFAQRFDVTQTMSMSENVQA